MSHLILSTILMMLIQFRGDTFSLGVGGVFRPVVEKNNFQIADEFESNPTTYSNHSELESTKNPLSPSVAVTLSSFVTGTLVVFPTVIIVSEIASGEDFGEPLFINSLLIGASFGPGLGYHYIGRHKYALLSSLGRLAICLFGVGGGIAGVMAGGFGGSPAIFTGGIVLGSVSVLSIIFWDIYDIVRLPKETERLNREKGFNVSFSPLFYPDGQSINLTAKITF